MDRIQLRKSINTPWTRSGRRRTIPNQEAIASTIDRQVLTITSTFRPTTTTMATSIVDGVPEERLLPSRTTEAISELLATIGGRGS